MPATLSTTIGNINNIPNKVNAELVREFYQYMVSNDSSERHQNNSIKAVTVYARSLDAGSQQSIYILSSVISHYTSLKKL